MSWPKAPRPDRGSRPDARRLFLQTRPHHKAADGLTAHALNGHQASLWDVMFHPATLDERNQRNVLVDGIGVGLASGIGTFLSVFLVRLGASDFLVGLLTAMPTLTGMILAMPVGEFLTRQRQIVPWFSKARLFVLSCYALTGLVPFLVARHQPEAIILIWAAATLPQTIVTVAFTVVMGGVAGASGRFTLMSRRWSVMGLTNTITVLVVGQVLGLFVFPLNYQIIFIGSAVGGLISYIFSSSIKLPPAEIAPQRQSLLETIRVHGNTLRKNQSFVNFIIAQFVFQWGLALPTPLFPIYWVRNVQASDSSISLINSVTTAVTMVAYLIWTRANKRRGERWVLLLSTVGVSFYPLLTALTGHVALLIIWAAMAGFFVAGINLVFFDIVLSTCPEDHQAAYVGMYQTTIFVATFLAPMVGSTLASTVGIVPALMLGTGLRLAGAGLMGLLKVGKAESRPAVAAE